MNGADWYDVRHRQLIITTDGTVKEEECLSVDVSKLQRDVTIIARSSRVSGHVSNCSCPETSSRLSSA